MEQLQTHKELKLPYNNQGRKQDVRDVSKRVRKTTGSRVRPWQWTKEMRHTEYGAGEEHRATMRRWSPDAWAEARPIHNMV